MHTLFVSLKQGIKIFGSVFIFFEWLWVHSVVNNVCMAVHGHGVGGGAGVGTVQYNRKVNNTIC
jgi:hypothetical protein